MSSPTPPHTITVEASIGGGWTDITGDVYQRQTMSITNGATGEQGVIQPARLTNLILNNTSLKYSPNNPTSAYYGQFVKGTGIRVSAGGAYRFYGKIIGIKPWSDLSHTDLYIEIEAASDLHRLGQGNTPVKSGPRAWLTSVSPAPLVYWPLEDGPRSKYGVPLVGSANFVHQGTVAQNWGKGTLADWLPPGLQGQMAATLNDPNDARFTANIAPQGFSTSWALDYYVNGFPDYVVTIAHTPTLGSNDCWSISMSPSVSTITVNAPISWLTGGNVVTNYVADGKFHYVRFQVIENFVGDANFWLYIDGVTVASGHVTAPNPEPVIDVLRIEFDLSDHQPTSVNSQRVSIGHVAFWENVTPPPLATAVDVAFGRSGEASGTRLSRLCTENAITLTSVGTLSTTPPVGAQKQDTLKHLLQECADAGGGMLFDSISSAGLTYVTRDALYDASVALSLDLNYANQLGAPLVPADDDQVIRNDVTVSLTSGGSQNVQITTGPNAIAANGIYPGVGRYDTSVTLNLLSLAQALDQAGWRAWVGTYSGPRFPSVLLNLSILPLSQRSSMLAALLGSRIQILNLYHDVGYDTADLLLVGTKETLSTYEWFIELVCNAYGPYNVLKAGDTTLARPDSSGTIIWTGNNLTTTTTTFYVQTNSGPQWITTANNPSDFPFDINVEGERMTVTSNIYNSPTFDQFTVTRSVNGVVKAHTGGVPLSLWTPMIAAM